ncbi:hypothetical protein IQ243_22330 [Nostocales cyanobacterium LEGE 11386]|nr:hypothetical protein [Nostocales cyanobacterium LEGE 11386]
MRTFIGLIILLTSTVAWVQENTLVVMTREDDRDLSLVARQNMIDHNRTCDGFTRRRHRTNFSLSIFA